MQTFKKTLIAFLVIALFIGGVSALIIEPLHNGGAYYSDANLRESLSGGIDLFYVGDSDGMYAFRPVAFDEISHRTSYNLSGTMMTMHSRYHLLKKEIARNPVRTVVIQISPDALWRKDTNYGDGDSVTLSRLDHIGERISFLFRYVAVDDWLNIYSRQMISGLSNWEKRLIGEKIDGVDAVERGWRKANPVDIRLSAETAVSSQNSNRFETDFNEASLKDLERIISLCKENNIQLIIVSQPFSDAWIWSTDEWDNYGKWLREFSERNGCAYIDFNLLKCRYELFSDEFSFKDDVHMSELGAKEYTAVFADVLSDFQEDGQIDDTQFYDSYEEMEQDSPYFAYIQTP